jgi:hypothetical protein
MPDELIPYSPWHRTKIIIYASGTMVTTEDYNHATEDALRAQLAEAVGLLRAWQAANDPKNKRVVYYPFQKTDAFLARVGEAKQ